MNEKWWLPVVLSVFAFATVARAQPSEEEAAGGEGDASAAEPEEGAQPEAESEAVPEPEAAPEPEAVPEPEAIPEPEPEPEAEDSGGDVESFLRNRVELHGYGNWGGGWASANHFQNASPHGEFRHVNLGLRQVVRPIDSVTLWAGIYFEGGPEGLEVELDLAFASWQATDWLRLEVGRMFFPTGLYAQTIDIGTLRPFQVLPQAIYGNAGFFSEAFNGASVVFSAGDDWRVNVSAFGGAAEIEAEGLAIFEGEIPMPGVAEEEEGIELTAFGGVAAEILPPVPGMRLLVGGFAARVTHEDVELAQLTATGAIEYRGEELEVRAEYMFTQHGEQWRAHGAYAEAAYRFIPQLQAGLRAEWLSWDLLESAVPLPEQLTRHFGAGATLNYWIIPDFVIRVDYHFVYGNRLSHQEEELEELVQGMGTMNQTTHAVQIGTSFTY